MNQLPVLFSTNGAHYNDEFQQYSGLVAVLAGHHNNTKSWRLGFVTQEYWDANTTIKDGIRLIQIEVVK